MPALSYKYFVRLHSRAIADDSENWVLYKSPFLRPVPTWKILVLTVSMGSFTGVGRLRNTMLFIETGMLDARHGVQADVIKPRIEVKVFGGVATRRASSPGSVNSRFEPPPSGLNVAPLNLALRTSAARCRPFIQRLRTVRHPCRIDPLASNSPPADQLSLVRVLVTENPKLVNEIDSVSLFLDCLTQGC